LRVAHTPDAGKVVDFERALLLLRMSRRGEQRQRETGDEQASQTMFALGKGLLSN
jgi:hypothetical protein